MQKQKYGRGLVATEMGVGQHASVVEGRLVVDPELHILVPSSAIDDAVRGDV